MTGPSNIAEQVLVRLGSPFHIFRYLWDSEDLHFGLFDTPGQPLLEAVARMTARLESFLPSPPARVLDLGTGFGATARRLAARKYQVVGIAPDPALVDHARAEAERLGLAGTTRFEAIAFEQLPWSVEPPFDAILSQESLQYLRDLPETFRHLAAVTRPGARVVIGDQVLRRREAAGLVPYHERPAIVAAATAAGFNLFRHEDVTAQASPTMRRTMDVLLRRRVETIAWFRARQRNVEQEFDAILLAGSREVSWFERGEIGYELFVFDRR